MPYHVPPDRNRIPDESFVFSHHRSHSSRATASLALALAVAATAPAETAGAAPRVVATIGPVHSLVAGVMAGVAEPALLVRAGASPHNYQMRPSDAAKLRDAEIVFWIGPALETFLQRSIGTLGPDARVLTLMNVPGVSLLANRRPGDWQKAAHEDPRPAESDGHRNPGQWDPHIWLSPMNALAIVSAIERELALADPDNAGRYAKNAARIAARLDSLQRSTHDRLLAVADVPFVVFHDGYQYLEYAFDLRAAGSLTLTPFGLTSARRLAELRDLMASLDARCVFREPQFEPALIDTLVDGTDVKVGVLDPLGASIDPGPDAYFELMEFNARSMLECLSP